MSKDSELATAQNCVREKVVFEQYSWLFRITVLIIFLAGLGIRLYDLRDAPLDFHPTRQLYSALKARGMYYQNLETAPDWQRELAVEQWKTQGLIEPPLMERMAAIGYSIAGQEILWLPRLFSIIFWMMGGIALLLLSIEVAGKNGAVFSLLFYLFTPYLVIASRSFQPDPLMVSLMVFSIWALVRWQRVMTWKWAVSAGLLAGLAIFVKNVVVFPIAAAFLAVTVSQFKFPNIVKQKQVWSMAVLAIFPYLAFMTYGLFINGQLQSQFSLRFFPQLWLTAEFWLQWNGNISRVIGFVIFLVSILGTYLLVNTNRRIVIALFAGYFLYGLVLPYHISTHDYYQLPLVLPVALGLAALFELVIDSLRALKWQNVLIVITVASYFLLINAWDARVLLKKSNYANEVIFWQEMGAKFTRDDAVIGITQDYGYRFEYWGWHKIQNWMSSSDIALRELAGQELDMQALFDEQIAGKDFFLVTQLNELNAQPMVKQLLFNNYPVAEETDDYIIFDLHKAHP